MHYAVNTLRSTVAQVQPAQRQCCQKRMQLYIEGTMKFIVAAGAAINSEFAHTPSDRPNNKVRTWVANSYKSRSSEHLGTKIVTSDNTAPQLGAKPQNIHRPPRFQSVQLRPICFELLQIMIQPS